MDKIYAVVVVVVELDDVEVVDHTVVVVDVVDEVVVVVQNVTSKNGDVALQRSSDSPFAV